MEIARERFLDDSRLYHLTLILRSRTTETHSLLTSLTSEERDEVSVALATALDAISAVVARRRTPRADLSPADLSPANRPA